MTLLNDGIDRYLGIGRMRARIGTRFENEKGTPPEKLIAAAHAGCFTMALAFRLQGAGYTPTQLNTEAAGHNGCPNPHDCRNQSPPD